MIHVTVFATSMPVFINENMIVEVCNPYGQAAPCAISTTAQESGESVVWHVKESVDQVLSMITMARAFDPRRFASKYIYIDDSGQAQRAL